MFLLQCNSWTKHYNRAACLNAVQGYTAYRTKALKAGISRPIWLAGSSNSSTSVPLCHGNHAHQPFNYMQKRGLKKELYTVLYSWAVQCRKKTSVLLKSSTDLDRTMSFSANVRHGRTYLGITCKLYAHWNSEKAKAREGTKRKSWASAGEQVSGM